MFFPSNAPDPDYVRWAPNDSPEFNPEGDGMIECILEDYALGLEEYLTEALKLVKQAFDDLSANSDVAEIFHTHDKYVEFMECSNNTHEALTNLVPRIAAYEFVYEDEIPGDTIVESVCGASTSLEEIAEKVGASFPNQADKVALVERLNKISDQLSDLTNELYDCVCDMRVEYAKRVDDAISGEQW